MKLSFVIPCYRSQDTIEKVYEEIVEVVRNREKTEYEIVMVNDASPDNVLDVLKKLAKSDERVKVIDCAKNMGKHAALMAGFNYTTGDYIICVDDDYQCPVDCLWELLEPLENGYDVSMAKYGKKAQSIFKNWGSKVNALMMTHMIGKPKDLQFANFTAMKKFVVDEIIKYDNPYSYVNGLILRTTNRIANVPMKERERLSGVGGYTFFKSIKLWVNGFTAFSVKPLRAATICGIGCSIIGFIYGVITIVRKVLNPQMLAGYSSILAVLLFVGGILMLMLGILGEYIGRIYICINQSPQYIIRETWNIDEKRKETYDGEQTTNIGDIASL